MAADSDHLSILHIFKQTQQYENVVGLCNRWDKAQRHRSSHLSGKRIKSNRLLWAQEKRWPPLRAGRPRYWNCLRPLYITIWLRVPSCGPRLLELREGAVVHQQLVEGLQLRAHLGEVALTVLVPEELGPLEVQLAHLAPPGGGRIGGGAHL